MIKIGILTYHDTVNYGSFLQCYSLCELLKNHYPDIQFEVINYTYPVNNSNRLKAPFILMKNNIRLLHHYLVLYRNFAKALRTLPLSKRHYVTYDYRKIIDIIDKEYNGVIVGADTVLNATRGFPSIYNLPGGNMRKFYVAASAHGLDYESISQSDKCKWKAFFDDFDFIGIRDSYTERFLNSIDPNINYCRIFDPTFFYQPIYDIESLKEKLQIKYKIDMKKKLIGVMTYSEEAVKALRRIYGNSCTIVSLYRHLNSADVFCYDLTPHEWAVVFSLFDFTLTQFFHCTLFSLLNKTPVVCFGRTKLEDRKCGKVQDLLEYFDMEECYLRRFDFNNSDKELCKIIENAKSKFAKNQIEHFFECGRKEMNHFFDAFDNIFLN